MEVIDLKTLARIANEDDCECMACEALRSACVAATVSYRWRWWVTVGMLALIALLQFVEVLGAGGLPGLFE